MVKACSPQPVPFCMPLDVHMLWLFSKACKQLFCRLALQYTWDLYLFLVGDFISYKLFLHSRKHESYWHFLITGKIKHLPYLEKEIKKRQVTYPKITHLLSWALGSELSRAFPESMLSATACDGEHGSWIGEHRKVGACWLNGPSTCFFALFFSLWHEL